MFELDNLCSALPKFFILCLEQNISFSLGVEVNIYMIVKKIFFPVCHLMV